MVGEGQGSIPAKTGQSKVAASPVLFLRVQVYGPATESEAGGAMLGLEHGQPKVGEESLRGDSVDDYDLHDDYDERLDPRFKPVYPPGPGDHEDHEDHEDHDDHDGHGDHQDSQDERGKGEVEGEDGADQEALSKAEALLKIGKLRDEEHRRKEADNFAKIFGHGLDQTGRRTLRSSQQDVNMVGLNMQI